MEGGTAVNLIYYSLSYLDVTSHSSDSDSVRAEYGTEPADYLRNRFLHDNALTNEGN